jgi:hypothetical protein
LPSANGLSVNRPLFGPPGRRAFLTFQRAGFVLVVLLAGWCALCRRGSAQSVQPENQLNVVRGSVVNALTNQPIGRALVSSTDNRYAAMTDGEGHFEFTLPKAEGSGGSPWLLARKPGFLEDGRGQVEMLAGKEVTISLIPEGLIRGRVSLPAADPVRGVDVELFWRQVQDGSFHWIQKNSVRTDSNGEFRFADLLAGTYKLLTREWMDNDPETTVPGGQLYGFPPVYYPSASDFAAASTIQLKAGQTFEADMSIFRQPYYPVKIPVTNAEQNGGMSVTVSPLGQRGPGYSLGYNGMKQTIEGQLPNGKYLVEAGAFGPNSSVSGSLNLTVGGAPADGLPMVLARNTAIPVNVKEEFTSQNSTSRMALAGGGQTFSEHVLRRDAQINAESVDDFGAQRMTFPRHASGASDDSLVLDLPPGRYWLRVRPFRGYVASATMGGSDLLREPLVVVPGASTPIEITMRDDSAELAGSLLGIPLPAANSGRRSPQGFVYCIPLPDNPARLVEFAASSEGTFDTRAIAPGIYRVIAFSSQQRDLPYRDAEAMKAYENKGQVVHFAPGQKVSLQLQVVSGSE